MALEDFFGVDGQPGSIWTPFTNPSVAWDTFKNGRTNILNKEIADKNLALQKEEQKWQHEFAVDERDYNRALQQQLFEREDTAIERQASQLSSLGINPLTQQLNGLDSGSPIGNVTPNSVTPQNNFHMQDFGLLQALSPLVSLADTINTIKTGEGQRDLIRAQADKQQLDNFIVAMKHGLQPEFMKGYSNYRSSSVGLPKWFDMEGVNQFNKIRQDKVNYDTSKLNYDDMKREFEYRRDTGMFNSAPDIANKFNYFASDSFTNTAEKFLTKASGLFDKAVDSVDNFDTKKIKKLNPIQTLLNLFF